MPLSTFLTIFGIFSVIFGHFRPICRTTLAHFRPLSVIFCTFSAHFRAIFSHFGHLPSTYDPFRPVSAISVIVWSLSAIIGNFWPYVAHFAAHLCQFSTIFDHFRPIWLIFCTIAVKNATSFGHFKPIFGTFSGIFGPFSTNFGPFSVQLRSQCDQIRAFEDHFHFRHISVIFWLWSAISGHFRPIYANFRLFSTIFGIFSAHLRGHVVPFSVHLWPIFGHFGHLLVIVSHFP